MTGKPELQRVAKPEMQDASPMASNKNADGDDHMDPMGFGAVGREVPFREGSLYFRNRLPPTVEALVGQVAHHLAPFLGQGDVAPGSNGHLAHRAMAQLEAARQFLCILPEGQREAGMQILLLAWQGGRHEATAMLRDTGLPNAKAGKAQSIRMGRIRKQNRENKAKHQSDHDHFLRMDLLIANSEKVEGRRLSERQAAQAVLYPDIRAIPASAAGKRMKNSIDALRKRYRTRNKIWDVDVTTSQNCGA